MLALTSDAALAHVIIAASAVPHEQRASWLTKFAQAADPPRTANARYSKRTRDRTRNGERVFHLTLNVVAVEEMLRADNLLPATADTTHAEVERALTEFVTRLATYSAA